MTRDALHSKQADAIIVDEAWRHDPARRRGAHAAASPTMATSGWACNFILRSTSRVRLRLRGGTRGSTAAAAATPR